jgi:hypothetical protein
MDINFSIVFCIVWLCKNQPFVLTVHIECTVHHVCTQLYMFAAVFPQFAAVFPQFAAVFPQFAAVFPSLLLSFLQFAAVFPSGRMSSPTERDLLLPRLLPALPPPARGGAGCRAARQRNPMGPPGDHGRSTAAAHPSPRLPASPSRRVDGAMRRLVGESLTPLSSLPAHPPFPLPLRLPQPGSRRSGQADRVASQSSTPTCQQRGPILGCRYAG